MFYSRPYFVDKSVHHRFVFLLRVSLLSFTMVKTRIFLRFTLLALAAFALGEDTNVAVEPSETDELDEELPEPPKYEIPQGVQTLSFNPSNLTDEDQHSQHLPRDLKCDGCRVVAYVMKEKMKKLQSRYKKGHRLSESDVVDLLDKICRDPEETFNGYGLKEIMGVRRLSGDGLETKEIPGVQSGGGRWPQRLKEICFEYIGEVGEDIIYETFIQRKSLENLLCRDKMGPICPPRKKNKDKDPEKEDENAEKLDEQDEKEASKKKEKKAKKDKKSGSKEMKGKKSKKPKQKDSKGIDTKKKDEEKKQKKHKKEKEQKKKSESEKKDQDKKTEENKSDKNNKEEERSKEKVDKSTNENSDKQDKDIAKEEL